MNTAMNAQASAPKANPRIEARLDEYIEAHGSDLAFYSRLVSEDPTRAVRILLLRDMELTMTFEPLPNLLCLNPGATKSTQVDDVKPTGDPRVVNLSAE